MKFNKTKDKFREHRKINLAGGEAYDPATPEMGLYKVVINNLLEDKYYETDAESFWKVAERFERAAETNPEFPVKLAEYARNEMYLRDVSQVLLVLSANHDETKEYVREYAPRIIQRADELNTVVAIQLEVFGKPIPKPLKKGVAEAFHNFDRYQFAKYNNLNREVKFRDVMNLVHPKPETEEEEETFERLVYGDLDDYDVESLNPPETWEVVISKRGNNAEAWRDVLPRMGLFAKIRNLRNMLEAGLEGDEILDEKDLEYARESKIYPFRFYQAYKAVLGADLNDEHVEDWLTRAVDETADNVPDGLGETFVSVDLSGSMSTTLSNRGSMAYKEISSFFGAVLMRKGADVGIFASEFETVNAHHDTPTLELVEKIKNRDVGHSTNGWKAIKYLIEEEIEYDRVVLLTDMQIWDSTWGSGENTVKEYYDRYVDEVSDAGLYTVDLSSYGELVTPEAYQGVYNISGWNSEIIDFIKYAEEPGEVIKEIERY